MPPKPRPGEPVEVLQVPNFSIRHIIGSGGANINRLQETYGVSLDIPSNAKELPPSTIINVTVWGGNLQAAAADIQGLLTNLGSGNNAGAANAFGGGDGMATGGNAPAAKMANLWVFRADPTSGELQVLLEHSYSKWNVVCARCDQPGDDAQDYLAAAARILKSNVSGQGINVVEMGLAPIGPKTIVIPSRVIMHFACPPSWGDQFIPQPSPETRSLFTDAALAPFGYPAAVAHGHAWVHVALLQAHVKAHPSAFHRDVDNWFVHNAEAMGAAILAATAAKFSQNPPPGPAPVVPQPGPAAAAAAAPHNPLWVQSTVSAAPLAEDFLAVCRVAVGLPQSELVRLVGTAFDEGTLRTILQRLRVAGCAMPHDPAAIP